ncbi:MAG: DUF2723 domain-containing protein [Patescibacteria group bacterium]
MITRLRLSSAIQYFLLLFSVGTVYFSTLPKSIGYGDAGLLAAAAATLGVPHPPGFPSYMILAHIFTLLPFGTMLFRLELLSVLSSLLLLLLLFWYLKKHTGTLPALFSCLALAGSYGFWSQSLNVETFLLTNLVIVCVMILVELSFSQKKNVLLAGILFGIGLGLNPIVIAVVPSLLYFSFARPGLAKLILFSCAAGVMGLISYSYLPLRATAHPFVNWSDPSTLDRFLSHIFGGGLSIASGSVVNGFTGSIHWYLDAWLRFFILLAQEFALILLPLFGIGIYSLFKINRSGAIFWLLLICTNVSLAGLYTSGNRDSWYITSFVALAVFLSYGIHFLINLVKTRSDTVRKISYISITLACIFPLVSWYPSMHKRAKDTGSYTYINDIYYKLPDSALLIGGGETFNSLTAYAHEVLKTRPDITPIDFTIYYGKKWYRENMGYRADKRDRVDMPKFTDEMEFSRILEQFARANSDRRIFVTGYLLTQPMYANSQSPAYIPIKFALRQHGIIYELVSQTSQDPDTVLESPSEKRNTWFL